MRNALAVLMLAGAWFLTQPSPALAVQPSWSGDFSVKRFAATKSGTSLAARQPEPDFADTYSITTACTNSCVATWVAGPPPKNPTIPMPPRYDWDGVSWVRHYDWQWDCWQGDGVPKVWAPAHSVAMYTPQPDGTLAGTWRTDIDGGPCEGFVVVNVAAYPVGSFPALLNTPGLFGSS